MSPFHSHRRTPEKPFAHARPSKALQEEDAFMELHGGRGGRVLFVLAMMPLEIAAYLRAIRRPALRTMLRQLHKRIVFFL